MTLLQSSQGRKSLQERPVLHLGGKLVSTGAMNLIARAPTCLNITPLKGI